MTGCFAPLIVSLAVGVSNTLVNNLDISIVHRGSSSVATVGAAVHVLQPAGQGT